VEAAPAPWACPCLAAAAAAAAEAAQGDLNEALLSHGWEALCWLHMTVPEVLGTAEVGQGHVAEQSREPQAARAMADQHNVLIPDHCRASVGTCLLVVAPWYAGLGGRRGCMDPGVVVLLGVGPDLPHTSLTCGHHAPLHQTWHNVRSDAPLEAAAQPLDPSSA